MVLVSIQANLRKKVNWTKRVYSRFRCIFQRRTRISTPEGAQMLLSVRKLHLRGESQPSCIYSSVSECEPRGVYFSARICVSWDACFCEKNTKVYPLVLFLIKFFQIELAVVLNRFSNVEHEFPHQKVPRHIFHKENWFNKINEFPKKKRKRTTGI